jgi:hypothetical protein
MVAEIFDYFSAQLFLGHSKIDSWLFDQLIVNGFILFEPKMQGDWRIIERSEDFQASNKFRDIMVVYGGRPNNLKGVTVDGKVTPIAEQQTGNCSPLSA